MDYKRPITVNGVPISLQGHTHDFSTFPVLCVRSGKSATQSYSSNTTTKLTFDTMPFNTGLNVDLANERLIFPSVISGYGIFEIYVYMQLSGTSTMAIYVYKNGSLLDTVYSTTTASDIHNCNTMAQFSANDYIEIFFKGGTARTIQTTTVSYIKQVA
jgi:hypothetical protein